MPNFLADVALLLWIPIGLAVFAVARPPVAAAIVIVGASLLLPAGYSFDFPGLPAIDRELIASLSALVGCLVFAPQRLRNRSPGQGVELLGVLLVLGAFGTMLTNRDPIGSAPGLTYHDALSTSIRQVLRFWLPFFIGRALFRAPSELGSLLVVLTVAALLYSLPILWEMRMSPNLHLLVYGYAPANFFQQMRGGGYRPMVFVGHGLALAMFVLSATIAAIGLARMRTLVLGFRASAAAVYLSVILFLCHSAAALVYGVVVGPLLYLGRLAVQARIILIVAAIVLSYPLLRALDWFPTTTLVEAARLFSEDRAESLDFRFVNEDALLEKARERLLFGWGGWGRSLPAETSMGRPVTDGFWIITFGQDGAVGFLASFGLLLAPAILAALRFPQKRPSPDALAVAATSWIVLLDAVDLLPNAFLMARATFIAGALAGAMQGGRLAVAAGGRARRRQPAAVSRVATSSDSNVGRIGTRPRTHR